MKFVTKMLCVKVVKLVKNRVLYMTFVRLYIEHLSLHTTEWKRQLVNLLLVYSTTEMQETDVYGNN